MDIKSLLNKLFTSNIFKKEIVLARNYMLKNPQTPDTNIYFVKDGSLKVSLLNDGEEQIIRLAYTGDFVVSLDSFLTEESSDYSIQAIKKTIVLVIDKQGFIDFFNQNSENKMIYVKILENLILQQLEREKDLLFFCPKERFQRVFKRNPKLFQIIPNKHIANYLRMTPETLSRLKKNIDLNQDLGNI